MESREGYSRLLKNYPVKGKITLSALGTPSLDDIMIDQEVFEYIFLHLILPYFLLTMNVENLNKTSELFDQFCTILLHADNNTIHELFQHDPGHTSQTTIAIEHRLKFLFLVALH